MQQYDVFMSYSRRDNETGWVTALKEAILEDSRVFGSELWVFLDVEDINTMDEWEHRILGALRTSKVLLICVSPNYLASDFCRAEWEGYLRRQARVLAGQDTIASVYFVEIDGAGTGSASGVTDEWRQAVLKHQHVDLHEWFPTVATPWPTRPFANA